MSTVNYA